MRLRLAVAAVLLAVAPAFADGPPWPNEHSHPPEHEDLHHKFYSTWMRPAQPQVSCCNLQDCEPVKQVRKVGERWEAQRESDGQWLVIPPHTIEQQRDSPDGRSHMCSRQGIVFCFVHGSGT